MGCICVLGVSLLNSIDVKACLLCDESPHFLSFFDEVHVSAFEDEGAFEGLYEDVDKGVPELVFDLSGGELGLFVDELLRLLDELQRCVGVMVKFREPSHVSASDA